MYGSWQGGLTKPATVFESGRRIAMRPERGGVGRLTLGTGEHEPLLNGALDSLVEARARYATICRQADRTFPAGLPDDVAVKAGWSAHDAGDSGSRMPSLARQQQFVAVRFSERGAACCDRPGDAQRRGMASHHRNRQRRCVEQVARQSMPGRFAANCCRKVVLLRPFLSTGFEVKRVSVRAVNILDGSA